MYIREHITSIYSNIYIITSIAHHIHIQQHANVLKTGNLQERNEFLSPLTSGCVFGITQFKSLTDRWYSHNDEFWID